MLSCQYLFLTEGNRLVGVHSQPHLRQVLPQGFGVVPSMSDVGATSKRRDRGSITLRAILQWPPASQTPSPSPLDPRRCLPSSIPIQTLSVDIIAELLPPSFALSLRHRADCRTTGSPLTPRNYNLVLTDSFRRVSTELFRLFLGNVVFPVALPQRLLRLPECNWLSRLRTTRVWSFSRPFHDLIRRRSSTSGVSPYFCCHRHGNSQPSDSRDAI